MSARSERYLAAPSLGAYHNDGTKDDARAGLENHFGFTSFGQSAFQDTNADGLPDARLLELTELPGVAFLFEAEKQAANPERLMVYQGAMTVEVARTEEAVASFLVQVKQWGGYLGAQQDLKLTVRLPSSQFDTAMAALRGMGRVLAESRQADDVTKQYTDLGIRLDNARKGRDRLLQLLQKAEKVEDMLAIEKELRRLTEEIERMEGELKYLADRVAMATLQVEFRSVAAASPQQRRPQPSRFGWINQVGVQAVREDF